MQGRNKAFHSENGKLLENRYISRSALFLEALAITNITLIFACTSTFYHRTRESSFSPVFFSSATRMKLFFLAVCLLGSALASPRNNVLDTRQSTGCGTSSILSCDQCPNSGCIYIGGVRCTGNGKPGVCCVSEASPS